MTDENMLPSESLSTSELHIEDMKLKAEPAAQEQTPGLAEDLFNTEAKLETREHSEMMEDTPTKSPLSSIEGSESVPPAQVAGSSSPPAAELPKESPPPGVSKESSPPDAAKDDESNLNEEDKKKRDAEKVKRALASVELIKANIYISGTRARNSEESMPCECSFDPRKHTLW